MVCAAGALLVARWRRRELPLYGAVLVIGLLGHLWPVPGGALRISFVDVGQGDGAIIRWPDRRVWLVDVGPAGRGQHLAPMVRNLKRRGIDRIDTIVIKTVA